MDLVSVTYLDGKEVKVGQVWQRPVANLFLQVGAVCVNVKPDRYVGRVLLGSSEVLRTPADHGSVDAAQRQAESLLLARVTKLLSADSASS